MSGYTGGTTTQDIARLRRMTAEPTTATYSDGDLAAAIMRYPVADFEGYEPGDPVWIDSYDLAQAASDIWSEKAANVAANFSFDADGASFQKQQQHEHYMAQARRYRALRVSGVWTALTPLRGSGQAPTWVGNVNDPYE
jgi:hypothetical protein